MDYIDQNATRRSDVLLCQEVYKAEELDRMDGLFPKFPPKNY